MSCVWNIWTRGNKTVLGNNVVMKDEVMRDIFTFFTDQRSDFPPNDGSKNFVSRDRKKHPIGWIKLNTDESVEGDLKLFAYGGLFRYENGN